MKSSAMLILCFSCVLSTAPVRAQVEDVTLCFRSGGTLDCDVLSIHDSMLVVTYNTYYGQMGEFSRTDTRDISLDSVRTVQLENYSSRFTQYTLLTIGGLAIAGSSYGNGSMDGALGVLGGALIAAVGLIGAVVSVSGPVSTYSMCLEHDARIARLRLSGELPDDTEWESTPELSSVRESVQRLYFSMNDESEFEGTLIVVREDELLVLFEDESLMERNETEELRSVPFSEITYIEEAPFSSSGDDWLPTWRPEEHDIQVLTRVSFRKGP